MRPNFFDLPEVGGNVVLVLREDVARAQVGQRAAPPDGVLVRQRLLGEQVHVLRIMHDARTHLVVPLDVPAAVSEARQNDGEAIAAYEKKAGGLRNDDHRALLLRDRGHRGRFARRQNGAGAKAVHPTHHIGKKQGTCPSEDLSSQHALRILPLRCARLSANTHRTHR